MGLSSFWVALTIYAPALTLTITVFSFKSVILAVDHVLDAQNSKIAPEEAFRLFRFAGSAVLKLSFLLTLCSCIHVFTVFDRPEFLGPPLATFYLSLLYGLFARLLILDPLAQASVTVSEVEVLSTKDDTSARSSNGSR